MRIHVWKNRAFVDPDFPWYARWLNGDLAAIEDNAWVQVRWYTTSKRGPLPPVKPKLTPMPRAARLKE